MLGITSTWLLSLFEFLLVVYGGCRGFLRESKHWSISTGILWPMQGLVWTATRHGVTYTLLQLLFRVLWPPLFKAQRVWGLGLWGLDGAELRAAGIGMAGVLFSVI